MINSKATGLINANKRVMANEYFESQWFQALADQANFALNGDIPVPFWSRISAFPQGPVANAVNQILAGSNVKQQAEQAAREIERIIAEQ